MKSAINSANRQRNLDIANRDYPRLDRPYPTNKPPEWIAAYQNAYLNPRARGAEPIGKAAKESMSIKVDPVVLETARELGINLSVACQVGLELEIDRVRGGSIDGG
jgi:Post-segregation antitoxin CcdA